MRGLVGCSSRKGSGSDSDWISLLPDEVLGKILCLLLTKVAASTSVLSKRWRSLLALVDTLCFDDSLVLYPNKKQEPACDSHGFLDFVDKTFSLLRNSPIKKFSLRRELARNSYCHHECARVNRWFLIAMERGFPEIHMHTSDPISVIELETNLLTSKTLVKLSICGSYMLQADRMFFLAFISLSLLSVWFDVDNYYRLLAACPVLEELFIHDDRPEDDLSCTAFVESASLKRLVVFSNITNHQEEYDLIHIEAPSLVYLDYSSYVALNYHFLDLGSLIEARLSLRLWESTDHYDYDDTDIYEPRKTVFGDVTNLLAGITNITTLHLSPDSVEISFCNLS